LRPTRRGWTTTGTTGTGGRQAGRAHSNRIGGGGSATSGEPDPPRNRCRASQRQPPSWKGPSGRPVRSTPRPFFSAALALACLEQSLTVMRAIGDRPWEAPILRRLGLTPWAPHRPWPCASPHGVGQVPVANVRLIFTRRSREEYSELEATRSCARSTSPLASRACSRPQQLEHPPITGPPGQGGRRDRWTQAIAHVGVEHPVAAVVGLDPWHCGPARVGRHGPCPGHQPPRWS
jgi:hypothetical protein